MMRNRCPRQDAVLGRFWVDFGSILGRFGIDFGTILGRFWDDLGFILGLFLKGFWRPFVAASVANYMTSLRMRTSQLPQKSSQLSKNMRFPSPQLADQVTESARLACWSFRLKRACECTLWGFWQGSGRPNCWVHVPPGVQISVVFSMFFRMRFWSVFGQIWGPTLNPFGIKTRPT